MTITFAKYIYFKYSYLKTAIVSDKNIYIYFQSFYMTIDTGSTDIWLMDSQCTTTTCGRVQNSIVERNEILFSF